MSTQPTSSNISFVSMGGFNALLSTLANTKEMQKAKSILVQGSKESMQKMQETIDEIERLYFIFCVQAYQEKGRTLCMGFSIENQKLQELSRASYIIILNELLLENTENALAEKDKERNTEMTSNLRTLPVRSINLDTKKISDEKILEEFKSRIRASQMHHQSPIQHTTYGS